MAHERLRAAGLKLTVQRRAVIEELAGDGSHPTAEELAARLARRVPGISLSTVYKVLHELADLGLVRQLDAPGAMRFDPDVEDHLHVVCDRCGQVIDVELPTALRASLRDSAPPGVTITHWDVVARGMCPGCAA